MKTLFVSADIHSYYDEWMKALKRKKFDINNPDHIIVVCGDIFDRGPKPVEVYEFLKNLPKERKVLVRGNHEYLLKDLVSRKNPENHDLHNGTLDTVYALAGWDDAKETHDYYKHQMEMEKEYPEYAKYARSNNYLWEGRKKCYTSPRVREVLEWIFNPATTEWVNYFELDNYIFVHGFIPLQQHINFEKSQWAGYFVKDRDDTFREDWRNATDTEFEDATWFNWRRDFRLVRNGINQTGKFIVVGHWHTSDLYILLNGTKKFTYDCPIYISKRYKIIGLDACTAGSGKVNVMKLEIPDEEWEKWRIK